MDSGDRRRLVDLSISGAGGWRSVGELDASDLERILFALECDLDIASSNDDDEEYVLDGQEIHDELLAILELIDPERAAEHRKP